jgi:PAS domain S-box-containing protein
MLRSERGRAFLAGLAFALPVATVGALLLRIADALAASNAYRRAVLDAAVDGIVTIDDQGVIHSFNPAAEAIFGYSAAEVIGHRISLIIPEPYHVYYKLISTGTEVVGRRKDGTTFPMDLTSGRMQLGEQRLYIGIARDITRFKRAEEDLARARDAAEAANRAKSAFLLNMSHELRTPLNHVIGYSDLLAEDLSADGHEQYGGDIRKIRGAGEHLLKLIEGILELTRLESDTAALESAPVDVPALLTTLADEMADTVAARGNTLHLVIADDLPPALADAARLRQVLAQLIDNAAKFTEGGMITITAHGEHAAARSEEPGAAAARALSAPAAHAHLAVVAPRTRIFSASVLISVSDTGIGMPPDDVARLFEPFVQSDDSTTRAHGGVGLGLAIAARLCRMMQGELRVTSAPGAGSTFSVRLPVA